MSTGLTPERYALVAIRASVLAATRGMDPQDAWESAAFSVFPDKPESRKKGCPKGAFLGLAEAGHIAGIPAGNYTRSVENKQYAVQALQALRVSPVLADDPQQLWKTAVRGRSIRHNEQMSVVIALWKERKFRCQIQDHTGKG